MAGPLSDAGLLGQPPGSWRPLTPAEAAELAQLGGMAEAATRRDGRARATAACGDSPMAVPAASSKAAALPPTGERAPPTALAVVPRGFGVFFARALRAGAASAAPLQLPGGGSDRGGGGAASCEEAEGVIAGSEHGGEAGIDLVAVRRDLGVISA